MWWVGTAACKLKREQTKSTVLRIREPLLLWPLDPDPGSRISSSDLGYNQYFPSESLIKCLKFFVNLHKLFCTSTGLNVNKNKNNVKFCEIYGFKKVWQPLNSSVFFLLLLDPQSRIRGTGWKKSGSGMNLLDPQHWCKLKKQESNLKTKESSPLSWPSAEHYLTHRRNRCSEIEQN